MNDNPTDRPTMLTAISALQEEVKLTNLLIEDLVKLTKQLTEKEYKVLVDFSDVLLGRNREQAVSHIIPPAKRAPGIKSQILTYLATKHPLYATAKDIAKALQVPSNNIHPRLIELTKENSIDFIALTTGKIYRHKAAPNVWTGTELDPRRSRPPC